MLVICCGMIRSGSTLQYNLVKSILGHVTGAQAHGWITPVDLEDDPMRLHKWADDTNIHLVKSHVIPENAFELAATGRARFCYIFRDLRDVAVSAGNKWGHHGEELYALLADAIRAFDTVNGIDSALLQRYEHVMADVSRSTCELAGFLEIPLNQNHIDQIAEANSIDSVRNSMREQSGSLATVAKTILRKYGFDPLEKYFRPCKALSAIGVSEEYVRSLKESSLYRNYFRLTSAVHPQSSSTLLHPDHISKNSGAIGCWKTELDPNELHQIEERFGYWLADQGYMASEVRPEHMQRQESIVGIVSKQKRQ